MLLIPEEMNFLGHVVPENGIECDPRKIDQIKNLQAPKRKTGVRAILGIGNYYRCFIKEFLSIVAPLQRHTHNDVDFSLGDPE